MHLPHIHRVVMHRGGRLGVKKCVNVSNGLVRRRPLLEIKRRANVARVVTREIG